MTKLEKVISMLGEPCTIKQLEIFGDPAIYRDLGNGFDIEVFLPITTKRGS